jgi:hypothetical protein
MNNTNEKVFAAHVAQAIERATAIGSNATWTTEKHLDALAETLALPGANIRETLGECYNISQYQQELDRKFRKAGSKHFNREGKKTVAEQADDLISQLARGTK